MELVDFALDHKSDPYWSRFLDVYFNELIKEIKEYVPMPPTNEILPDVPFVRANSIGA